MTIKFYIDLSSICKERNHTLTSLAELSGIQQATLSRIKTSKSISLHNLSRLATALKIDSPEKLISVKRASK